MGAFKSVCFKGIARVGGVWRKFGAQLAHAEEVSVNSAAPYLVTTGFCQYSHTETGQQWACKHDAASQGCALYHEVFACGVVYVDVSRTKRIVTFRVLCDLYSQAAHELYQVEYI